MFDVAAILINFNTSKLTKNCIESIIKNTSPSLKYQIIVIDNSSAKDDYLNLIKECKVIDFEHLKIVRNDINVGFGAGNMLGVHYSNAKYLAFINNDTILKNDCLFILKEYMDSHLNVGVTGGQAFAEDGHFMVSLDHFVSPVKEIFGRKILETINPEKYPKRKKLYALPTRVNYVQGSFMLFRTEDFNTVGGFDTNLFLYYEETDICKRLLKMGKTAFLVPEAHYIHLHGASTESSIIIKKELKISLMYVIRKHYGFLNFIIVLIFMQVRYFFSSIFKPKNWAIFFLLLSGASLTKSLKLKQPIIKI